MARLEELRTKIDSEDYTAYLPPASEGMTSYQVCRSVDPQFPGYWFTRNAIGKPDKEHFSSWEKLLQRRPSWPVLIANKWEVM